MPSLDILSDSAKRIGAVNTVTKQPDGKLHGDNPDWLGIKNQFESRLMARGGWAPAHGLNSAPSASSRLMSAIETSTFQS